MTPDYAAIEKACRTAANSLDFHMQGSSGYLSVANSKISAISNAIAAELRKLAQPTT